MKMIIISPQREKQVFDCNQFAEFHHWLFASLAGIPKEVSVDFDEDYNEVYTINYA